MSFILLVEQAAPETPSTNQVVLYPKSDGFIYSKDDTGTESVIASGSATQAQQEAGVSTAVFTSPGRQQYHPSAAKFWIKFNGGGTPAASASYNLASISDDGTGAWGLQIATDFSSANWCAVVTVDIEANAVLLGAWTNTQSAGALNLRTGRAVATNDASIEFYDASLIYAAGYGDQ